MARSTSDESKSSTSLRTRVASPVSEAPVNAKIRTLVLVVSTLFTVACGGAAATTTSNVAQGETQAVTNAAGVNPLVTAGSNANFGVHPIQHGFTPDPKPVSVVSGGGIDASTAAGLPAGCRGWVTPQPDLIVNWSGGGSFLRFFTKAAGDTTLVINDGAGHWYCDDDTGGERNAQIDLQNPPNGQYDIWIGSYRENEQLSGAVFVTELPSVTPATVPAPQ